jgi:hypothetical protein
MSEIHRGQALEETLETAMEDIPWLRRYSRPPPQTPRLVPPSLISNAAFPELHIY